MNFAQVIQLLESKGFHQETTTAQQLFKYWDFKKDNIHDQNILIRNAVSMIDNGKWVA